MLICYILIGIDAKSQEISMNLLFVGVGYVGLVAGTCFAEMGHHVICLDTNQDKIAALMRGEIPIYEPGLEEMVLRNLKAGRLQFSSDYPSAVEASQVCFITVDTPTGINGHADLQYVQSAVSSIAACMNSSKIIVNKSTVPVGTTGIVKKVMDDILIKRNVPYRANVVSNPEFLKEGNAINDFMKPDRVIIGSSDAHAIATLKAIYSPFMLNHDRLIIMDAPSAEMTKYAANTMLALRISFMNELSGLCELTGADITKVRRGIGSDKRIGNSFLYAGPGFGGSCFPKDVRALGAQADTLGYDTCLIKAITSINRHQKSVISNKILRYFAEKHGITNSTFAILGLSFKPDTDDIRESASLALIEQLLEVGAKLRLYDPIAMPNTQKALPHHRNISWCTSEADAAMGADAIVLMTEWKQFRLLDFKAMLPTMCGNAFFDGRNQFDPATIARQGFDYISIGRAPSFAGDYAPEDEEMGMPSQASLENDLSLTTT